MTYDATDHAGNKAQQVVRTVKVIDQELPLTAEVQYSTTEWTNQDVTVTLIPSKTVTADTVLTHTYTENGSYTFTLTDLSGNTIQITVEVTWIDKIPPTTEIEYSTTSPTNGPVTAKLINISEPIKESDISYTFTENGEHSFTITDQAGNTATITARVDWIDKMPPTAEVEYSTTAPTNGAVTAKLVNISEPIKEAGLSYTFTENGEHTFIITDQAGNTANITARVDWIDKIAPQGTIAYSTISPTTGAVTATISFDKKNVTVTNNGGSTSYVFTENGEFIFEFEDIFGNKGIAMAKVTWIDNTPLPPVETIAPIGNYIGKVRIERNSAEGRIDFTITSLTEETIPAFDLFVAEYDEDGRLVKVQSGKRIVMDDSIVLSADLPELKKYKIMIWDEMQLPVIEAIN